MDQQTQSQPPVEPAQQASAGQQPQKSGSKVWLWILGGCLTIVIIAGLVIGGLVWWGAKKVKKAIQENQPKLEEMQKNAKDLQNNAEQVKKGSDQLQQQMENAQRQLPNAPY
jgi:uncharacterized protein HemX